MKILYTSKNRVDAEVAAATFHRPDRTLALEWAGSFDDAKGWLSQNPDLAALIVDAQIQDQSCDSFVSRVRTLGVTAPIIVVIAEETGPPLAALKAGADDYVAKTTSPTDLAAVVDRALQQAHVTAGGARQPVRLLYAGDSTLARECVGQFGRSIAISEATRAVDGTFDPIPASATATPSSMPFDVLLVEHDHPDVDAFAILKAVEARTLRVPVIFVVEWDEALALPALKLGATDVIVKTEEAFSALFFKLERGPAGPTPEDLHGALESERAGRAAIEQKLVDAAAAVSAMEARHTSEMTTATARIAELRAQHEAQQAKATRVPVALARQINELKAALAKARHERDSEAAVAAKQLAQREAEAADIVARAGAARTALELRLADAQRELQESEGRLREWLADDQQLSRRRIELEARLADEVARREVLEQKLCATSAALAEAQRTDKSGAEEALQRVEQLRAAEAAAAAAQLAQQGEAFTVSLAQVIRSRDALEQQLDEAERRASDERAAAADQMTRRETEFQTQLNEEKTRADTLETGLTAVRNKLESVEAAHFSLQQQHTTALNRAATQADDQTQLQAQVTEATASHATLELQLAEMTAALEQARQERLSDAAAASIQFAQRETDLAAAVADLNAARDSLQHRLDEAVAKLQDVEQCASNERQAAQRQQAELAAQLQAAVASRGALEEVLANTKTAFQETEQEHASAITDAASRLAEQKTHHEMQLAQAVAEKDALRQQLDAMDATLAHARQEHESAVATGADRLARRETELAALLAEMAERLARREAELTAAVADVNANRDDLEQRLAKAHAALHDSEERAAAERLAAAAGAASRQSEFDANLEREIAERHTLEQTLACLRQAADQAAQEHGAVSERTRELETRLADQDAQQRHLENRIVELQEEILHLRSDRDDLQQACAAGQEQLHCLTAEHEKERNGLERARAANESELHRRRMEYAELQQTLDQHRRHFELTIEQLSTRQAIALSNRDRLLSERDRQLNEQLLRQAASEQASKTAFDQRETELRDDVAARSRELEQLGRQHQALEQQLQETARERDMLRTDVERLTHLQKQLDESLSDLRRQFHELPFAMCQCSRNGAITRVNRAMVRLLGYRTPQELTTGDLGTTVFESAGDLRWLLEHCSAGGAEEPVETAWKRKDGTHLVVRLFVRACASDLFEIVVQDITDLRLVEERLRRAQRMEAVGRVASEVAVTCDNLLRGVSQNGEQWLATMANDAAFRLQGQQLLGEVTRVASFLRQLSVYGDKQTVALEPVDAIRVLRDLEPVLKQVTGNEIDLALPKQAPAPIYVDIDADRLERVLINVAGYARERMRSGGRLMIDLARVVVGHEFIAKYPNVRQGEHVLITVSEMRGNGHPDRPIAPPLEPAERHID
ncbi:MAG: hypothetical protein C5B57_04030, partial [Blastocatellia bacterium]